MRLVLARDPNRGSFTVSRFAMVLAASLPVLVPACSSDDVVDSTGASGASPSSPPSSGETRGDGGDAVPTGDSGGLGSGGKPGGCQLELDIPTGAASSHVPFTFSAGEPPAPQGGAIVDGTYELARIEGFRRQTAGNFRPRAQVLRLSETHLEWAQAGYAPSPGVGTLYERLPNKASNQLEAACICSTGQACPSPGASGVAPYYTVKGSELSIFSGKVKAGDPAPLEVYVFAKRP